MSCCSTANSAINTAVPWDPINDASYGSLMIANSGADWTLTSFHQSTLAGLAGPSDSQFPFGTCGPTAVGTTVWVPADPTVSLPKTVAVGPSGFYRPTRATTPMAMATRESLASSSPAAALSTAEILSHQYLGFTFEPGADYSLQIPESQLAAFGPTAPAGQLVGGGFPLNYNTGVDDPTQPDLANLIIDLGEQDAKNPGVYPNVSITNTITGSIYASPALGGYYNTVAVAGQLEGKYAIFIIGYDTDYSLPLGIYLFQQ